MYRNTVILVVASALAVVIRPPVPVEANITVQGTQQQKNQVASWLSTATGTTVTVGTDNKIAVGPGGNAAATRLRNMANDSTNPVTLDCVNNDSTVSMGGWQSSDPANSCGPTTGTQKIDTADLANIGNVLNSYGFTPGTKLMHEITEVYEGKKSGSNYDAAHRNGVAAEQELMNAHSTSWYGPQRYFNIPGSNKDYMKVKRPDGTYVVAGREAYVANEKVNWYTERVACQAVRGLIPIADPDPNVRIFQYDGTGYAVTHTIDAGASVFPKASAYDVDGFLHVAELCDEVTGAGQIRVFDPDWQYDHTISDPSLKWPEGIDVDKDTAQIFVAAEHEIRRYDADGTFLGTYSNGDPNFRPTDVAVWRNHPTEGIWGDGTEFDLFVTDGETGNVVHFDVDDDLNQSTYQNLFGSAYLDSPEGLGMTDQGYILVASTGNNEILAFGLDGSFEMLMVQDVDRVFCDVELLGDDGIMTLDFGVHLGGLDDRDGALLWYDFEGALRGTYGVGDVQCPTSLTQMWWVDEDQLVLIPEPALASSDPPADGTLPKTQNNIIVCVFDAPITLPPSGDPLVITELADPNNDLSGSFTYSVDPNDTGDPTGATLKATETGAVLLDQTWYRVTPDASFSVNAFTLDLCTLRGDANNSARVTTADYTEVKNHMGERTDARYDLNGSARVTTADYIVVKDHMGNRTPSKP